MNFILVPSSTASYNFFVMVIFAKIALDLRPVPAILISVILLALYSIGALFRETILTWNIACLIIPRLLESLLNGMLPDYLAAGQFVLQGSSPTHKALTRIL